MIGDSVSGTCWVIIGFHTSCASTITQLNLKMPPLIPPCPIGLYIWEPLNRPEHSVSLAKDDNDFCRQCSSYSDPPYCPHLNHMGSSFSTTSIEPGLMNLAYQDQLFFPQMDCAHLLTLVQTTISSIISLGSSSIMTTILMFAASHLLNLHVALGSLTISTIVFLNPPINSAWMVQF